jgi:hypothetical protein
MNTHKYYIRVFPEDKERFEEYLDRNGIRNKWLATDIGVSFGTSIYSLDITDNQASVIKLSFKLIGCLNLNKALDGQLARSLLAQSKKSV